MSVVEVRIPDLGEAKGVNVVEVLVKKGSEIRIDDPLITIETDKASMDVPSPLGGRVAEVKVKIGDRVSEGSSILTLTTEAARAATPEKVAAPPATTPSAASAPGLLRHSRPVACPRCGSIDTECISEFGSTPCKALHRCRACLEPFEYFKCI